MKLILFDFDGTITRKDSLIVFIKYVIGDFNYYKGLLILSPMLLAYKLKIISNNIAKEKLIAHFFKGWDKIEFQSIANNYSIEKIDEIIRPKALERIKWHQEKGHTVVIVSASVECWLKGWCKKNNLGLIGTKLEVKNNKLTGKFSTKNCYGIEKVNRIKEKYNLSDYNTIFAYGDSGGDKEMLSIADKKHYKYFE
jgi:phosphatidylglycerophosphatase C